MKEIPDIFISPTQSGKVGVTRRRNENSGMTMEGDDEGDDARVTTRVTAGVAIKKIFNVVN